MPPPSTHLNSSLPRQDFASVRTRVATASSPRQVFLGLAVFALLAGGWELILWWRGESLASNPTELVQTAHQLRTMAESRKPQVTFVGSSRTFIGISPGTVREELDSANVEVRVLALAGASARPLAELLDTHVQFRGVVVIEVFPSVTYIDASTPSSDALQAWLARARWFDEAEHALLVARTSLRMCSETNAPMILLRDFARRFSSNSLDESEGADAPISAAFIWHQDGWVELRPNKAFLESAVQDMAHAAILVQRYANAFDVKTWAEALNKWEDLDRRFAAEGVKMVFVRFPSGRDYLKAEEEYFPDNIYWSALSTRFPGRCWHFMDNPRFHKLYMPDGSHLVSEDALAFSRWIARKVKPLFEN
ncbi:MAG: hypothetical protein IT462_02675 [Planctomycetes bacterium]|nr:hypothetical protein [Planctomycetota bacterium]